MNQKQENEPLLLTSAQAAKKLNICQKTLFNYTKDGFIPCVRIGRNVRYSVSQLQEYIEENLEFGSANNMEQTEAVTT